MVSFVDPDVGVSYTGKHSVFRWGETAHCPEMDAILAYLVNKKHHTVMLLDNLAQDIIEEDGFTKKCDWLIFIPLCSQGNMFMMFCRLRSSSFGQNFDLTIRAIDEKRHLVLLIQVIYWWYARLLLEQERTLHNQQLKNKALATISHEVRTPLNIIVNFLEMTLEHPDVVYRPELQDALEASKELSKIVNDVILMTRLEMGKIVLESVDFDLKYTIENCISLFKNKPQIQLKSDSVQHGLVRGDQEKLHHIIYYLVY